MPKKSAGLPAFLTADIARAVAAGHTDQVLAIPAGRSPPEQLHRLCRRVDAARDLNLENQKIIHASGVSIAAIASWCGMLEVAMNVHAFRFQLLAVDRKGECVSYAIPVQLLSKSWSLPGIAFSEAELKLLRIVADEISDSKANQEYRIELSHPTRTDVRFQLDRWHEKLDEEAFLMLLRERPWLLSVVEAALDVLLRSFKLFRDGPLGIYNFIASSGDVQADENFCAALQAMNFTAAPSFMGAAVPEIIVREQADLRAWRGCHDRIALIRTATGSLLTPLLDEIDARGRLRSCGGILPPRLSTVPIIRCKAVLNRPGVVDIALPKGEKRLTGGEQDMLRSAMALAVNGKVAQAVYDCWRDRMADPGAYRRDPFAEWCETIETVFLKISFASNPKLLDEALTLLRDTQARQELAEQEREQLIAKAIDLIGTPSKFARQIIVRPASKEEPRRWLDKSQEALAFHFQPTKGDDAGQQFLAFSAESLKRLLKRAGCGEELYDAVLAQTERLGMLDQRNRTIKLGQGSFTAVTFLSGKC